MQKTGRKNLRWTSDQVLSEIRAWRDQGEPLYANHVRLMFQELLAASIRYYGSWQKAVETAGIPYDQVRKYRKWSNETIIQEIRDLHTRGVDLSFRAIALSQHNAILAVEHRRGLCPAAIHANHKLLAVERHSAGPHFTE